MNSDLRNIATYEEQYAADNVARTSVDRESAAPLQGFSPSQNVRSLSTNVAGPPLMERDRFAHAVLRPAT